MDEQDGKDKRGNAFCLILSILFIHVD